MSRALLALGASLSLHAVLAGLPVKWEPPSPQVVRPLRLQWIARENPAPRHSPRELAPSTPRPVPQTPSREPRSAPTSRPKPNKTRPELQARPASPVDNYPRARRRSAPRPAGPGRTKKESVGGQGEAMLEPPVLIRGPETIAIPDFLRNRDGHFRLSLKCRIEADASSRVEVWDGTGCPELDENVRQSFSGRNWYPALLQGRPLRCTVRLTVESSWKAGQSEIHWGGRVPTGDLARY